eukprot:3972217-Pleurochrysis_carterae.AAC.2
MGADSAAAEPGSISPSTRFVPIRLLRLLRVLVPAAPDKRAALAAASASAATPRSPRSTTVSSPSPRARAAAGAPLGVEAGIEVGTEAGIEVGIVARAGDALPGCSASMRSKWASASCGAFAATQLRKYKLCDETSSRTPPLRMSASSGLTRSGRP